MNEVFRALKTLSDKQDKVRANEKQKKQKQEWLSPVLSVASDSSHHETLGDFIHTPVCEAELVNPFYPLYSEFRLRPRAVTSGVISAHGVEERQARSVRTRSYWSGVGCRGKAISSFHMVVRERPIDDGRVDITFTHL